MGNIVDLRSRRVYSFSQIDAILNLRGGTAARWIDGYTRKGVEYDPVVRPSRTGDLVATWGEFIECRFLADYRTAGVSIQRLRPAIIRLRETLGTQYPLADANLWLEVNSRELVMRVQDETGLDPALRLVVRTGQGVLDWTESAASFVRSIEWSSKKGDAQPLRLVIDPKNPDVEVDPLRGLGDPVIRGRNVTTSVLMELLQSGESIASIADAYDLSTTQVEAAIRFESRRAS